MYLVIQGDWPLQRVAQSPFAPVEISRGSYADDEYRMDYYTTDHLGSVRVIMDMDGEICQNPGLDVANPSKSEYLYGGKELQTFFGIDWYDSGGRFQKTDGTFSSLDPKAESYYPISPYAYCAGDPVNKIDLNGRDTINISYNDNKWIYSDPIISEGDDVFIVSTESGVNTYTFSEGHYGKRVSLLNLDINEEYALGIYYISNSSVEGIGYFVAPGGSALNVKNSNKRVLDGDYPMTTPIGAEKWRQPGLGGNVINRGIKFHFGNSNARKCSEGCFVISSDYELNNNSILYNRETSIRALIRFDNILGASKTYEYTYDGKKRTGAEFPDKLDYRVVVKSR